MCESNQTRLCLANGIRTKWHYTKNAIILTTMKSIISNLLPSSMQCNMRLVYHALKIKANSSKMSFLPHGSSNKDPALVWKSGFEHLLFTLVFNLKFNLLKQLKAHTSWPNTLSHTFTRTRRYPHIHAWNLYGENVECAKSVFFAYPTNQTIHSTQSSKATGKRIRNEDDNNSNHGSKKIAPSWVNRLHSAGGWWRVSCISSAHTATKQAEGAKRFNYFTRVFKTNILWPFAVCFLFIAIRHKRRTYMRSLIHSLTWTHQRPML